jgi:hypothetical protein
VFADYNNLIKSKPLFWTAYEYRGKCKQTKSDFAGAIHDYSQYINGREYEISYDSTMLSSNVNFKNEIVNKMVSEKKRFKFVDFAK